MKKTAKIILLILISALTLSLFGCQLFDDLKNDVIEGIENVEDAIDSIGTYSFSDVVITQVGLKSFRVEFTVRCGDDPVEIYLTEGYRLSANSKPVQVEKAKNGTYSRFSFISSFDLGESYYVWAVCGDKQEKFAITPPSMFPVLMDQGDGSALFHFKYTYGTAWSDFCDPEGKAIYKSASPVFDSSAELIVDKIAITQEDYLIPADAFDPNMYYFAVSTVKDGFIKIISSPVVFPGNIVSQVNGVTATITNDLFFRVDVEIASGSELANSQAKGLQLMVKTDIADDVLVSECTYANGVATMMIDYNQLGWEGIWYDVCIAWNGAVLAELPQYFNGKQVNNSNTVQVDGIIYGIAAWKAEDAAENTEVLKMYFEKDSTRYADEFCRSYLVTFTLDPVPTLKVTIKLRNGVTDIPVLALTGGDETKICEVKGTLNDDGTYTFELPVKAGMTTADKWYDVRLFFGKTPCELLKDSCITYEDYSAQYVDYAGGRTYTFREYNGMLKIMFLPN